MANITPAVWAQFLQEHPLLYQRVVELLQQEHAITMSSLYVNLPAETTVRMFAQYAGMVNFAQNLLNTQLLGVPAVNLPEPKGSISEE
jgi:hypothetical protein